jgi:hypothetical protein
VRFHEDGKVPAGVDSPKLREMYRISNERVLYLRLTSPHEAGETLEEFLDQTVDKIKRNLNLGRPLELRRPIAAHRSWVHAERAQHN